MSDPPILVGHRYRCHRAGDPPELDTFIEIPDLLLWTGTSTGERWQEWDDVVVIDNSAEASFDRFCERVERELHHE